MILKLRNGLWTKVKSKGVFRETWSKDEVKDVTVKPFLGPQNDLIRELYWRSHCWL